MNYKRAESIRVRILHKATPDFGRPARRSVRRVSKRAQVKSLENIMQQCLTVQASGKLSDPPVLGTYHDLYQTVSEFQLAVKHNIQDTFNSRVHLQKSNDRFTHRFLGEALRMNEDMLRLKRGLRIASHRRASFSAKKPLHS